MTFSVLTVLGTIFGISGQVTLSIFRRVFLTMILFTIANVFWILAAVLITKDVPSLVMWLTYLVFSSVGIWTWRPQNGTHKIL